MGGCAKEPEGDGGLHYGPDSVPGLQYRHQRERERVRERERGELTLQYSRASVS